jgi:hypothetical protein
MTKVLVDKKALGAVILALNGQPHEIRELIALRASKVPGMRSISELLGEKNPIDQLEEDLLENCTATDVMQMGFRAPPDEWENHVPARFTEAQLSMADPELKAALNVIDSHSGDERGVVDTTVLGHVMESGPPVKMIIPPVKWLLRPDGVFPDRVRDDVFRSLTKVASAVARLNLAELVEALEETSGYYRQWPSGQSWEKTILCVSQLIREHREYGRRMFINGVDVEVTGVSVYRPNDKADFTVNVDWFIKQHLMVPKFDHDQVLPVLQHNGSDVYARFTEVGTINGQYEFYHVHDETPGNVEVCEPSGIAMTHIPLQERSDKIIESYRKLHVTWPKG